MALVTMREDIPAPLLSIQLADGSSVTLVLPEHVDELCQDWPLQARVRLINGLATNG